jgi:hypothetical protein
MIAAVLSPILVLLLCAVHGLLARSLRAWLRHSARVLGWVALYDVDEHPLTGPNNTDVGRRQGVPL